MTQALDKRQQDAAPIRLFEKALGGRQAVIESLVVDSAPEIQRFVQLLCSPDYDDLSIGELAIQAGISLTDLLRAYRNATLAKAQILAVNEIAQRLPKVVADVMERALPTLVLCPVCRGEGTITKKPKDGPLPCKTCEGKGKVARPPSVQRQRLALEIAEVLKPPKHGPALLAQFNIGAPAAPTSPTSPGSLDQLQAAVAQVLSGRGTVIDVTPEEPPDV